MYPMKHKGKHGFDPKPHLAEIARILPTVKTELHREALEAGRDFLLYHAQDLASPDIPPVLLPMFAAVLESLWYCGVSPEGYPAPPPPTAPVRVIMVPMVDIRNSNREGES